MDFVLQIFPSASLASSVVTTVWIGIFIVCFLNLRLGWALSGLIVPGYLVPLLIVKPWSAFAVLGEAVLTYGLIWCYSERLARLGGSSSLFGRDRFFALVLVSILVRVVADGWLWPAMSALAELRGWGSIDFTSNLQSFGLVIIALTANLFYKTGLLRGLLPLTVTIGGTYLVVRFGLMEFTNFSIAGLSYMYEDLATSVLAGPKSYIILLTAAFLASRMNLSYGWDFNGILLPSLLALQWYQPEKILATFVEAFVILLVAASLLKTRWFANAGIEGARKLLFFFNIGFAWKMLLGYLVPVIAPDIKVTDTYGFGYILATLIAIKIYDKDILARFTRATVQTSVTAVLIATAVGFALSLTPGGTLLTSADASLSPPSEEALEAQPEPEVQLAHWVRQQRKSIYQVRAADYRAPSMRQLDRFSRLIDGANRLGSRPPLGTIRELDRQFGELGFALRLLAGRYLTIQPRGRQTGYGFYVIDLKADSQLLIELPNLVDAPLLSELGRDLFEASAGRALAAGGTGSDPSLQITGNALRDPATYFHAFHRVMAAGDVLQLRGLIDSQSQYRPALAVKQGLPPGLDLYALQQRLGDFEVVYAEPGEPSRQRVEMRQGFASLALSDAQIRRVLSRSHTTDQGGLNGVEPLVIDGQLNGQLFAAEQQPADRGSGRYVPPELHELLMLDNEVLSPLMALAQGPADAVSLRDVRLLDRLAAAHGLRVRWIRDQQSQAQFLMLDERFQAAQRHWGQYIFRIGSASDVMVQVPRPGFDLGSYEFGIHLFEQHSARALLVAGSHPDANLDGSADVLRPDNQQSVFSLVTQVGVREYQGRRPLLVQSRSFGRRIGEDLPDADVLVSHNDAMPAQVMSPAAEHILEQLEADGLHYAMVGTQPQTAGYEIGFVAPSRYAQMTDRADVLSLRLSTEARASLRPQTHSLQQVRQFRALGIPSRLVSVRQLLLDQVPSEGVRSEALNNALPLIQRYQRSHDIVVLADLARTGARLERLVDNHSYLAYLAWYEDGRLLGLFNLNPRQADKQIKLATGDAGQQAIRRFLRGGVGAVLLGEVTS